ncbi:MAG TPA: hypothetical protein VLE74_00705 [Candidatus Saccharimonadales bacterium]|nr:hypothetical protein [Candidatus Saccharimonadales bacterium]
MKAALVAIIAIIIVGGAGWFVYDKNHNKTPATSQTPAASETESHPAANAGEIVTTKTDSKKGDYLTDSTGMTLYTYGPDKPGVSNCSGS